MYLSYYTTMKLSTFLSGHKGIELNERELKCSLEQSTNTGPIIHSPIGNDLYIENNPEKSFEFLIKEEDIDIKDLQLKHIYGELKCVIKKRIENGVAHYVFIIVNLNFFQRPTPKAQKSWKVFITQLVREKDKIEEIKHCQEVSIVFNDKLINSDLEFFSRFLNVEMQMKKSFISIINKKYHRPTNIENLEIKLCKQEDIHLVKEILTKESRSMIGQKLLHAIKAREVYLIKTKEGVEEKVLGLFRTRKKSITLKDVQKYNESLKFCIQMVPLISFENKLIHKRNIETLYISDFYLREQICEELKVQITKNVFYLLMNNKYFSGTQLMSLPEYSTWLGDCSKHYFSINIDSFIYKLSTKY